MSEASDIPAAWEKQSHESQRAYEAFRRYLELGPRRSIAKVAEKWSKNAKSSLYEWQSHNDWSARAAAYDAWMQQKAVDADVKETEERGRKAAVERELLVADSVVMARDVQERLFGLFRREWGDENAKLTLSDLERGIAMLKEFTTIIAPLVGWPVVPPKVGAGQPAAMPMQQTVQVQTGAVAGLAAGPSIGTLNPDTAPAEVIGEELLDRAIDGFLKQFLGEVELEEKRLAARNGPPEVIEAQAVVETDDEGKENDGDEG